MNAEREIRSAEMILIFSLKRLCVNVDLLFKHFIRITAVLNEIKSSFPKATRADYDLKLFSDFVI
jgi:hypothetical protein